MTQSGVSTKKWIQLYHKDTLVTSLSQNSRKTCVILTSQQGYKRSCNAPLPWGKLLMKELKSTIIFPWQDWVFMTISVSCLRAIHDLCRYTRNRHKYGATKYVIY